MSKIDYARGSLDQLAVFVAVVRERSFTAAAAKLNVSQSAELAQLLRQYPDIKIEMIVDTA
jgi:DNA-binding transcriptional LysR family regulator